MTLFTEREGFADVINNPVMKETATNKEAIINMTTQKTLQLAILPPEEHRTVIDTFGNTHFEKFTLQLFIPCTWSIT